MTTLAVWSQNRRLGQITLDGKRLTGSTPALQNIADVAAMRAGGDVAKAYAALDGWTNGYLTIITAPPPPTQAAAWDPGKHRRKGKGEHGGGEFTDMDATGLPPVPADLSQLSRDQLIGLLADQAGWIVDHNLAGHPAARARLRALRGALHGDGHARPGDPASTPQPGTPGALLTSMAGDYHIEPGVTAARKQEITTALAHLPGTVRQDIKNNGMMRRVTIRQRNWDTEAPEGTVTAIGRYDTDRRELTISAESGDAGQTGVHESLHAFDREPSGAAGRFSRQADFTGIAAAIRADAQRHPGMTDPHYAPDGAPPGRLGQRLLEAGNAEMFAELGADYLAGYPYNLQVRGATAGALPAAISRRLDAYYSGVFHAPRAKPGRRARAAAETGGRAPLSCTRTASPDGWLFTDTDGAPVSPVTGDVADRSLTLLAEQGPHAAVPGRVDPRADIPLILLQAGHADKPQVERLPEAHPGAARPPPPARSRYLLDKHASP